MEPRPRHNLPAEVTSFVGRAYALAEIGRLLGETRLLTLVGPGGSGKTRLALRAAMGALGGFPDGAWLTDLTTISEPRLVPQAIATALGIVETGGSVTLEALAGGIGQRRLLLVLDNCEFLVTACAEAVETLLAASPNLRVLATSREPLRAAGEAVWPVPPLALPATGVAFPLDRLEQVDAVRLFADRARARRPGFALTPDQAPGVVEICRRVDGIPLALELAAAQTGALTIEQIAAHLDNMLGLLTGGRRSVARQETLRATLDWSHALLREPEQVLFRRLAVFAGGFDLAAAEQVGSMALGEAPLVMPNLIRLVEQSLVVAETGLRDTRYRLLEPVRQYALERLQAAAEEEDTRRRHAFYYLSMAETAAPKLTSGERAPWIRRIEADHDNLRATLLWGNQAARDPDGTGEGALAGLRLAGALCWFWFWDGRRGQGRQWAEEALNASAGLTLCLPRAQALYTFALLAWASGDVEASRNPIAESVNLFRTMGDEPACAHALLVLDMVSDQGEHSPRGTATAEAATIFRRIGDQWGVAQAFRFAGLQALLRGDYVEARQQFEAALACFRALGDSWEVAQSHNTLGDIARRRGEAAVAGRHYEEALDTFRQQGAGGFIPSLQHNLGYVALRQGQLARARSLFSDSLHLFHIRGDQRGVAECLDGLAGVLAAGGEAAKAAALLGASHEVFGRSATTRWYANQPEHEQLVTALRNRMGTAGYQTAFMDGGALPLEDALKLAGAAPTIPPDAPPEGEKPTPTNPLSAREREVAALLASGYTNRQLGERLFIAEGTAGLHVKHILSKLQFTSRAQVAAWAVEQGLANASASQSEE